MAWLAIKLFKFEVELLTEGHDLLCLYSIPQVHSPLRFQTIFTTLYDLNLNWPVCPVMALHIPTNSIVYKVKGFTLGSFILLIKMLLEVLVSRPWPCPRLS